MNAIPQHWDIVRSALADEKRNHSKIFRTKETDFLPAALEITERPVSPTARATAKVLLVGLVITVAWLVLGKVDVVASAQGRLIPADNVKLIQSAEAGVVRSILVRDGQKVDRGQPLIELDPTISTADLSQAQKAMETALLDAARNRAILAALEGRGLNFVAPLGTSPEVASIQVSLARAQLAEIDASASGSGADVRAAGAARREALVQAAKLRETIPLIDEQLAANEALLDKGYVSKLRVIEMRRQRLAAGRDRDIALETASRTSAQMASVGSGGQRSRAEARVRILADLARAEAEAKQRREELAKASQRSSLQRLTSPVDGTVTQLVVHTVGGVVEAGRPLMVVVPTGGSLIVEAKLLNKDAGFVRLGQAVAIKLEAFPFTRHGMINGVIETIGSDAANDEKLGPVFPVRVRLSCGAKGSAPLCSQIGPGMVATADVRTGRRSIVSYLMSPIDEARLEAGRER